MTQQDFFNRYKYSVRTDKIGGGSFGTVYKAEDETLDTIVAIKVSEVKVLGGKEFSLLDEFKAIKDIPDHKNIANYQVLHTFEMPNGVFDYAIMQYYKDGNLSAFLKTGTTLEQKEQIAKSILKGISHLHNHKVVHRDLKPSNILIVKKGNTIIPKITDFGLSKKADPDAKSRFTNSFGGGTLEYSSPEQLKGENLRFNTDLWAYGVIVYEIFTGKKLFSVKNQNSTGSVDSELEIVKLINNKDLTENIQEMPEKWQNVLVQCLDRNPAKRIKNASAIFELLETPKKEKPLPPPQPPKPEPQPEDEPTIIEPPKPPKPEPIPPLDPNPKKTNWRNIGIVIGAFFIVIVAVWLFQSGNNNSIIEGQIIDAITTKDSITNANNAKWKPQFNKDFEKIKSNETYLKTSVAISQYKKLLNTLPTNASTEKKLINKRIAYLENKLREDKRKQREAKQEADRIAETNRKAEAKRQQELKIEADRIAEAKRQAEIKRQETERINKQEYDKKLDVAKKLISYSGSVTDCKNDTPCRNNVINKLNKALKVYPNGNEAKQLIKQLQN